MPKHLHKVHKMQGRIRLPYLLVKIATIALLLFLVSKFKPIILIAAFEILDFAKVMAKPFFPCIPLDLEFVFGIAAAYFYGPVYAVAIFLLSVINRILLSCIEFRHLIKSLRHIPAFFAMPFLRFMPFFEVAMLVLVINTLIKIAIGIPVEEMAVVRKFPIYAANFFLITVFFYMIHMIYHYLPILA
ncbi:MAG: hypothetical protein HGA85_02595 [Nanoarchaeota archaeon]|nr:hypothetical protein [Nanoarchaeota archaeon]